MFRPEGPEGEKIDPFCVFRQSRPRIHLLSKTKQILTNRSPTFTGHTP